MWQPKQADWSRSVWCACVCVPPADRALDCLRLHCVHNITYMRVRTKNICTHAYVYCTGRAVLCLHGCETSSRLARVRGACCSGVPAFVSGSRRFCARRPFFSPSSRLVSFVQILDDILPPLSACGCLNYRWSSDGEQRRPGVILRQRPERATGAVAVLRLSRRLSGLAREV